MNNRPADFTALYRSVSGDQHLGKAPMLQGAQSISSDICMLPSDYTPTIPMKEMRTITDTRMCDWFIGELQIRTLR